jgi:hypothetical protein
MPQRFVPMRELRLHGVTFDDVRDGIRLRHETWQLSRAAVDLLKPWLVQSGFVLTEPIHVHESLAPRGFTFTQ